MVNVLHNLSEHKTLMGLYEMYEIGHNEQALDETHHQAHSIRFLPLCDISDERYTVYFPVQENQ